jgi:hypothetical protein
MEQIGELRNVLADLHAHPTHKASLGTIVKTLSSPGLVGLTVKNIDKSGKDILNYEQALDLLPSPSFEEIDRGRLAKIGDGYFARTQEMQVGWHHVLALGWQGDYFPNFETIDEAVVKIRSMGGIAILNHPYTLIKGQDMSLPENQEEEQMIREAYSKVDEVETHNAHNIDLLPFGRLAMKESNRRAEKLRKEEFDYFKGTAASDCHRLWSQVKKTGIYIDREIVENGIDSIKGAIKEGNFVNLGDSETGPYVSRTSFVRGILGDMISECLSKN